MSFGSQNHPKNEEGVSIDEIQPFKLSDDESEDERKQARTPIEQKVDSGGEEEIRVSRPQSNRSRPQSNRSRPQSKPNLVERLENEADLDEFEQKEREILQQIEEEKYSKPNDDDLEIIGLEDVADDYNRVSNDEKLEDIAEEQEPESSKDEPFEVSVQNRQLTSDIRQQESIEAAFSDESDDYPQGFPVEAISAPPPAYSSNPPITGQINQPKQVQIVEDLKRSEDTPSRKTSEGIGGIVNQAGEIASALSKTTTSHPIVKKMSDEISRSSDEIADFDIDSKIPSQPQHNLDQLGSPSYRLSNDIKELFHYVEEFAADRIDIQAVLRPFFLDYIPAVGDVDAFLKIPRPDQIDDQLGLVVLDEPAAIQSDSTIVDMKLRQMSGVVSKQENAPVKKLIGRADKNQQHIENWIKNIKELRRSRAPDRVSYSRQMPDLEKLMEEWPAEIDAMFQNFVSPTASLDCSLEEYADICLSIVDIPVHRNRIHALHLLFSLYAEFKNSQHFRNLASNNANLPYGDAPKTADRLEL